MNQLLRLAIFLLGAGMGGLLTATVRIGLNSRNNESLRDNKVCELAAREQDPQRLQALVRELTKSLDETEAQLRQEREKHLGAA